MSNKTSATHRPARKSGSAPSNMDRRNFLRLAGATGALLALSSLSGPLLVPGLAQAGPNTGGEHTEQQTRLLMGTFVTLTAVSADKAKAEAAFAAAFAVMERLIAVFDRRNPNSALSLLNAQGSLSDLPAELAQVLRASEKTALLTANAFNPGITPAVDYLAAASARGALLSWEDKGFKEALALSAPGAFRVDGGRVRLERAGAKLTLDGIAKGFIADAASASLHDSGLSRHMVNAGGDIRVSGQAEGMRPWNVGIRHPDHSLPNNALITTVNVGSGGIATSGTYEQAYNTTGSRNHLLSHQTGKSAEVGSVTVRAQNAMTADALATALSLVPPGMALRLAQENNAACLVADRNGRIYRSANW
ncbi:FAD:protein FMN transferase [Desulfovibrio sp. OttesenSCG-928-A18]|nr:FAD:protein FMN transferase [Desulfovibrio sp. OttesenSCG-928-A18]